MLIPMGVAGVVGTFCVVSVNAWMNNPTGFAIRDGEVTDVNPWRAMFNDGVWLQFLHMWLAAFMVVGFVVSGVYAAGMLRGRNDAHHRLGFTVPFVFATVAALAQPLVGHVLGMRVARHPAGQAGRVRARRDDRGPRAVPAGRGADRRRGAVAHWRFRDSARSSPATRSTRRCPAWTRCPRSDWPPVNITHLSFQSMVVIGTLLAAGVVLYWLLRWRGHDLLDNRWFLRFAVIAGPLAILAVEFGWVATEVGRQPWTVWQVLRTSDAASMNSGLWWSYVGRARHLRGDDRRRVVVLRSMARRWRAGEADLPSPYGPPREEPVP